MSIFTKPYPISTSAKRKLIFALVFGLFVFLFLRFFQPFGINLWHPTYKTLRLLGYGLITTGMILFNSFVLEKFFSNWFKEENWKVWKEIVWTIWNVVVIGTLNLVYSSLMEMFTINLQNFLSFQLITFLIGTFPVVVAVILNYTRLQQKNLIAAQKISHIIDQDKTVTSHSSVVSTIDLVAENGKDKITLNASDLLVLISADNYVEVYYLNGGHAKKELLRNTIKNLEEILKNESDFFRCHRSYLVNLKKVKHVSGNSQGYKLHLDELEIPVPVSRSLNETIRKKISELHPIHPN